MIRQQTNERSRGSTQDIHLVAGSTHPAKRTYWRPSIDTIVITTSLTVIVVAIYMMGFY